MTLADEFNGIMIVIDTWVFDLGDQHSVKLILRCSFANSRHSYSFPRIMAIKGDGQTKYDVAHDGDSQALGSCSVRLQASFNVPNVDIMRRLTSEGLMSQQSSK
jgi:hypothetical protein